MSPYIEALPGKGDLPRTPDPSGKLKVWDALIDIGFDTVAGLLVTFIDGNNGREGALIKTSAVRVRLLTMFSILERFQHCRWDAAGGVA